MFQTTNQMMRMSANQVQRLLLNCPVSAKPFFEASSTSGTNSGEKKALSSFQGISLKFSVSKLGEVQLSIYETHSNHLNNFRTFS